MIVETGRLAISSDQVIVAMSRPAILSESSGPNSDRVDAPCARRLGRDDQPTG
jgi:hypothetical protein